MTELLTDFDISPTAAYIPWFGFLQPEIVNALELFDTLMPQYIITSF